MDIVVLAFLKEGIAMRSPIRLGCLLFAVCSIFLVWAFFYWFFPGSGYQRYVNSTIKPIEIHGRVAGKYKEKTGCFGGVILEHDHRVDTLRSIYYCTPPENRVWDYIIAGDSIYKDKGTLEVYIVRNGVRKKFIFPTIIAG